jgi:Domain of unknown function (DUF4440)
MVRILASSGEILRLEESSMKAIAVLFLLAANFHPVTEDPEIREVLALEKRLWEGWRHHDLSAIRSRTAPDYLSVSETGYSSWPEIEKGFTDYKLESYSLGPMRALRVSRDVIVLSYPSEIHGSYAGEDVSRRVAESTIWTRRNGRWMNVYLHEITVRSGLH